MTKFTAAFISLLAVVSAQRNGTFYYPLLRHYSSTNKYTSQQQSFGCRKRQMRTRHPNLRPRHNGTRQLGQRRRASSRSSHEGSHG